MKSGIQQIDLGQYQNQDEKHHHAYQDGHRHRIDIPLRHLRKIEYQHFRNNGTKVPLVFATEH